MSDTSFLSLLHTMMTGGYVVVCLLGVVVCIIYRRTSPRLMLVLVGFALDAFISLMQLVESFLLRHSLYDGGFERVQAFYLVLGIANLVAVGLIVGGLAATLADLLRRLALGPPSLPAAGDVQPWRPAREGSEDIHQG